MLIGHSYAGPKMGESFAKFDSRNSLPVSAVDPCTHSSQSRYSSGELFSLASHLFHDVNNRLLVIEFACEKLLRGLPRDDLNYATVLAIEEARQQAVELTHQFRDVQKPEAAKGHITDLNELVRRWKPLIMRVARESVIIEVDLSSKPAMVKVSQETAERILLHLCLSSLAIIADGGWLNIHTSHTDCERAATSDLSVPIPAGSVRLSISDTSCTEMESTASGDPDHHEASSIGFKNAALRRSAFETVGEIVREFGGQISVTTSADAGTRMDVFLPNDPAIDPPSAREFDDRHDVTANETILLVDDDALVRKFIKCSLESHGYDVIEADDASSAMVKASEHSDSLHLLVTDLRLGGTSGRELADRLRLDYPGLPVIFMSGLASDDLDLDASCTFLEKPFKPAELITAVRFLLHTRSCASRSHSPREELDIVSVTNVSFDHGAEAPGEPPEAALKDH